MKEGYFLSIIFSLMLVFFGCEIEESKRENFLLSPKEFRQKLKKSMGNTVVDVRTPEEFREGYIDGALNFDLYNKHFNDKIGALDKSKSYFVYCTAGKRSARARAIMVSLGFDKVYDLKGGFRAWKRGNLPVIQNNQSR